MPTSELVDMLSIARPSRGKGEAYFLEKYVDSLPGVTRDDFGNRIVKVTSNPIIAFSSHTDTVHQPQYDGPQKLKVTDTSIQLHRKSRSNCLGADCGTGVWIMRNMILEGIPGLYLFHREEETGMIGSTDIVEKRPQTVEGIQAMIAFDRMGTQSIITHQMGVRTASDAFANSFSKILGMEHLKPDATGSFTDSEAYKAIIPECTNVSVGYYSQHSKAEMQAIPYAKKLLENLLNADWGKLVITRDPKVIEMDDSHYHFFGGYGHMGTGGVWGVPEMERLVRGNVATVVDILLDFGVDARYLRNEIETRSLFNGDLDYEGV